MNNRDLEILKKIVSYCNEIDNTQKRFGSSFTAMQSDSIYKNAVSMCILQIGELTTHLTEEFKIKHNLMPWQDIKGMRNIAAHHYGKFDDQKLWETISGDIPDLKEYCEKLIGQQK